jgi:hypothetical protein
MGQAAVAWAANCWGGKGPTNGLLAGGEGQAVTGGGESWGALSSTPEERE